MIASSERKISGRKSVSHLYRGISSKERKPFGLQHSVKNVEKYNYMNHKQCISLLLIQHKNMIMSDYLALSARQSGTGSRMLQDA